MFYEIFDEFTLFRKKKSKFSINLELEKQLGVYLDQGWPRSLN